MTVRVLPELSPQQVQDRIAWAGRNGLQDWLWPDIAIDQWRQAMTNIADITRAVLAGETGRDLAGNDPQAISLAAYISGMGPLLGYWLETGRLRAREDSAAILALHLADNRIRNRALVATARHLVDALAHIGVVPIVLKGMHTSLQYFPEPGVRPMTDIDLHVPSSAISDLERLLTGLGYRPRRVLAPAHRYICDWLPADTPRTPRTLMHVHQDDPWGLDIQDSLNRRLLTGEQMMLDRLLAASPLEAWQGSASARVLGQPLLALYLAAHQSQGLRSMTMIRAYELALMLRKDCAEGRLDWTDFLAGARVIGGPRYVYPALHVCNQLAPGAIPADVLATCQADAPRSLQRVLDGLTPATAQPVRRHSLRERFMWAFGWKGVARQLAVESGLSGPRQALPDMLATLGRKSWALGRLRIRA